MSGASGGDIVHNQVAIDGLTQPANQLDGSPRLGPLGNFFRGGRPELRAYFSSIGGCVTAGPARLTNVAIDITLRRNIS